MLLRSSALFTSGLLEATCVRALHATPKTISRPREEWISHVDESLRIISDDLWERAQRRTRPAKYDARLMIGGKPKYMLSAGRNADFR
jgi:hypothetical protein